MTEEKLYILLADDDEDDRLFFKDALAETRLKTQVHTVNDGAYLMEYLAQPGIRLPDIIFLDLNMPRKGGIECLKEIRRDPRLKDICIAIYSTSSSEADIEDTFVMGANVYIRKPGDFNELKGVLEEVISINWQYQTSGLNRENFLLTL